MATIVTGWVADHPAVHHEYLLGADDKPELSLVRHPAYPFLADISSEPSELFRELQSVALSYLEQLKTLDRYLAKAVQYLRQPGSLNFGWLPITWDGPNGDPRGSFVVRRRRGRTELDRTVVLMAANRSLKGDQIENVQGRGVGLRVVMHVGTLDGRVQVRVTGLSVCELHRAIDPASNPPFFARIEFYTEFVKNVITNAARLRAVNLSGVEFLEPELLRFTGGGARTNANSGDTTGFLWSVDLKLSGEEIEFVSPREQEQRTYAVETEARPRLFDRDPASCGSGRDASERSPTRDTIDQFREDAFPLPLQLRDSGRFEVLQSTVADPENRPENVQTIGSGPLALRSDHLSAAQAYLRARQFFAFLAAVDLPEGEYFKFAQLPLLMRHRAAFCASPDGKAVRAQVRLTSEPMPFLGPYEPNSRPKLEVAFGSAALRHRRELPDDHGRCSAQPLGIAADPRWAWHEFGHVLSYAATGALEYQFAHSVGDALAAVLNDATSCLAGDGIYDGATYPWIPAGRRHDRDAAAGWCWCGRRNGLRYAKPSFPPPLYNGYVEEQILSSSVFRFYRAIGGHPENDPAVRGRAATATGYLLMRSALLLGPSAVVPARSADALVSAMTDADIGTLEPGELFPGGCLHKVLRWSFERQGLFATAVPDDYKEGYGQAPAVDVWVKDLRPNADPGGYEPVALAWPKETSSPDEGPAWFADPHHGVRTENGDIQVIVRNRGTRDATDVAVRAWVAPASSDQLQWNFLGEATLTHVPAGDCATAYIAIGPIGEKQYLLVEVSAKGDASNLNKTTHLPCASGEPPRERRAVRDLVVNDNNLALRLIS